MSASNCNSCVAGRAQYECSNCHKWYCIFCSEPEENDFECRRCLIFERPGVPLLEEVLDTLTIFDLKWFLAKQLPSLDIPEQKSTMIKMIIEKVGIQPNIRNTRQVPKTKCNSCDVALFESEQNYCSTCFNSYCISCAQINHVAGICTCKRCVAFSQLPPDTYELDTLTVKDLQWFLSQQEVEFDFNLGKQGLINLISSELIQSVETMRAYERPQKQPVYRGPSTSSAGSRNGGDNPRRGSFRGNYRNHNKNRFANLKSSTNQNNQNNENKDNCCRICMDNPINCALVECGHMVTCTDCGNRLSECPLCRSPVVRLLRVYSST